MPNDTIHNPNGTLTPTRRLTAKERKVFDRVTSEFTHLKQSDADMTAQYAEASVRYATAAKEVKAHPMVGKPVVNRSTGNVTGETLIRNPLFRTVSEAQAQMNSLARRLMIDAASAEKRNRLASKLMRALEANEAGKVAGAALNITEGQIKEKMEELSIIYFLATPETLRSEALWELTADASGDLSDYTMPGDDPETAYIFGPRPA